MAVKAEVETRFGSRAELYIRLTAVEDLGNHGMPAVAVFYGFPSKEIAELAKAGGTEIEFMFRIEVPFIPNVSGNIWDQAYSELKALDATPAMQAALDGATALVADMDAQIVSVGIEISELEAKLQAAVDAEAHGAAGQIEMELGLLRNKLTAAQSARPLHEAARVEAAARHAKAASLSAAFAAAIDV